MANSEEGNRYYKWEFLQHTLSRYVYNRSLTVVVTQDEMGEEQEFLQ